MQKTFKVAQVRDLLNQVHNEKITFSRFVEILNEQTSGVRKVNIDKLSVQYEDKLTAINEIRAKVNEIVDSINTL
jgi:hypothetical protein